MKKFLIITLFLALAACSLVQSQEVVSQSPFVSVSTKTPMLVITTLPTLTSTSDADDVAEQVYEPDEWKPLYDKDMVWKIELDPTGKMWVCLSGGEVGYFDGDQWVLFSAEDYQLPSKPFDMAIAPDGAVWVLGRHAISRYQHEHWEAFPMPGVSETAFPRMAIDSSGTVWVTMLTCYDCGNLLKNFDGKSWGDLQLWTTERWLNIPQLLFTPDGRLWAADDGGEIGQYDGKTWKSYSKMDLWSTDDYNESIRIASDHKGNVFGIYTGQSWIVRIDNNGNISKIPFDLSKFSLDQTRLRLFIDRQGTVWVNACRKDKGHSCLTYYKDNQWVFFTDLPFGTTDFNELPDGTLLVATTQGLYQFKSKN